MKIPNGINISVKENIALIKGPNGSVEKKLPSVKISTSDNEITINSNDNANLNTAIALIESGIKGVKEGFVKKMQIVYAHFPITIEVKENNIYIKNFIGEKVPRIAKLVGDCKIKVEKDVITIIGPDAYAVGQTVANVKSATKIKRKDPRVFQDGIYLI